MKHASLKNIQPGQIIYSARRANAYEKRRHGNEYTVWPIKVIEVNQEKDYAILHWIGSEDSEPEIHRSEVVKTFRIENPNE